MRNYLSFLSRPHQRLAIGCTLIYALLMSGFMTDLVMRLQHLLQAQQVQSALRLADGIAQQTAEALLEDDHVSLSRITSAFKRYPELDGIVITDPTGRVLAYSDERMAERRLSDARGKEVLQGLPEHALLEQTPRKLEVMSPVMQGPRVLGWARLSLDAQDNQAQINEVTQLGMGFAVLIVMMGSVTIYLVAGHVIRRMIPPSSPATATHRLIEPTHDAAPRTPAQRAATAPCGPAAATALSVRTPPPPPPSSWTDRDVLLKEIYHRVRNNLQIVQSLLSLQQRATDDSNVRKALDNSVRRIRSVALVHEMLYQSDDLSAISLPDYARRLVEELQGERAHIHFHLDIPAITVPLDNAVPLGLLLTELVGNSLQHAFARGVEGEVWIRVTPLAGNYIRLHVSDSGVGLENESRALPEPPGAVGLKLASALASQLGGLLKRQEAKGATFEAVLSLF